MRRSMVEAMVELEILSAALWDDARHREGTTIDNHINIAVVVRVDDKSDDSIHAGWRRMGDMSLWS